MFMIRLQVQKEYTVMGKDATNQLLKTIILLILKKWWPLILVHAISFRYLALVTTSTAVLLMQFLFYSQLPFWVGMLHFLAPLVS